MHYCWVNNFGSCCVHDSRGRLTDASTPDNVGACSASWEGYNPWKFEDHACLWPEQCWKSCRCKQIQHCCTTLRQSQNKRNGVGSKVWPVSIKLCATTPNNTQQLTCKRVFKWIWNVTSNYIGSCWPTNNVELVSVRLRTTFLCSSLCKYVFLTNECTSHFRIQYLLHQRTEIPSNTRGELSYIYSGITYFVYLVHFFFSVLGIHSSNSSSKLWFLQYIKEILSPCRPGITSNTCLRGTCSSSTNCDT